MLTLRKFAMRHKAEIILFLLCCFAKVMRNLSMARSGYFDHEIEIPYMVSIRTETNETAPFGHHICDGVITNEETVVTSAYCLIDKARKHLLMNHDFTIAAGKVDRAGSETITKSKNIFIHPAFDLQTKRNNVAVIILKDRLPLDNITIKSVSLARTEFPEGTSCIISGWGLSNAEFPGKLHKSKVYVMPKDECVAKYAEKKYRISDKHICAGVPGRSRSCYQNSGGPLVCNDILYGISSFDLGCGIRGLPHIYSNVKEYAKFIEKPDFDPYGGAGNYIFGEKGAEYYESALFTLILFILFVLCVVYFNTAK